MKRKNAKKRDVYQDVTDHIVAAIEAGAKGSDWKKPWKCVGLHISGSTGKPYRGINQAILWLTGLAKGYGSNVWVTYKQARAFGGHVRKGESGTRVVLWKFGYKEVADEQGKPVLGPDGKPKMVHNLLYATTYTIFNTDQCEELDESKLAKYQPALGEGAGSVEDIDAFVTATGAKITHAGDRACYRRLQDDILMPPKKQFVSTEGYYAALTHELTHWTGHADRCAREFGARFGDAAYAAEELVAEMGSAFLCAQFGVEGRLQHPEYVSHWLGVLKADKTAIFTASSKAQQAVDFLHGKESAKAQDEQEREAA